MHANTGPFLSTLNAYAPAVAQLPSLSHTLRVVVMALLVSVPADTAVLRVKLASAAFASPELASLAVHETVTSVAYQSVWLGTVQLIAGGTESGTSNSNEPMS